MDDGALLEGHAIWISAGAILVMLVLSGFFSGSETALTAASRPLMHQLSKQGNRRAALVNRLRGDSDLLIGGILLGNNLANILASSLATSLLIAVFGPPGVAMATVAMTLIVVIFSEVLPKTYAINNSERVALWVAPPIRVVVALLSPVTRIIEWLVRTSLRVVGVRLVADIGSSAADEELRGAIDLHAGKEVTEERAMLHSILDLDDVSVSEIMTHRSNVSMVDADLPVEEAIEQLQRSPYTRVPLFRGDPDNVVGVLHAKALWREILGRKSELQGLDLASLAYDPWFVPDTTTLLDQLQAFRRRREHFALVVDEYGSLQGIVTLEDIIEEIIGDIDDETDLEMQGVVANPDGSFVTDGSVTIRDLNREFDWNLPDEEAATIAGLVLHEARTIPEVGQEFEFHGFRFTILKRERNRITAIRVLPPAARPE